MPVSIVEEATAGELPAERQRPYVVIDPDFTTVYIRHPIQAHGQTIDSVNIHRPLGGDWIDARKAAKGADEEIEARLLSECADVPYSSVRAMAMLDLAKCLEVLSELSDF